MKLFLFLIGGTGSRVLKPLIMQLAAGVRPEGPRYQPGSELQIVPIIIDPHYRNNKDLKRTEELLSYYKKIRKEIYGDDTSIHDGFFGIRISSLAELKNDGSSAIKDDLVFDLSGIKDKSFREYIEYGQMPKENQAFCQMLFSEDQLDTKMDIGFVGSPNIGCVALNSFTKSPEFIRFSSAFSKEDRIFIVSSIFGGTGAAGYPLIVKNIRNAENSEAATRGDLRNAKIGALTVMPYFQIEQEDANGNKGRIQFSDFIVKTKSALRYYKKNLTGGENDENTAVNACYYLADSMYAQPYPNDDGRNGQKNLAHFVEFVGALSVFDFLTLNDDELETENGHALRPIFREYGLGLGLHENKNCIDITDLSDKTRQLIQIKMYCFHLTYMYFKYQLHKDISKGRDYVRCEPNLLDLMSTAFYTKLKEFFDIYYIEWLGEMATNQPRNFKPFEVTWANDRYDSATKGLNGCIVGIGHKHNKKFGIIDSEMRLDYEEVQGQLNSLAKKFNPQKVDGENHTALKTMDLLYEGFSILIEKFFSLN